MSFGSSFDEFDMKANLMTKVSDSSYDFFWLSWWMEHLGSLLELSWPCPSTPSRTTCKGIASNCLLSFAQHLFPSLRPLPSAVQFEVCFLPLAALLSVFCSPHLGVWNNELRTQDVLSRKVFGAHKMCFSISDREAITTMSLRLVH